MSEGMAGLAELAGLAGDLIDLKPAELLAPTIWTAG